MSSNNANSSSKKNDKGIWGKMKKASTEVLEKSSTASKNTKETFSIQKKEAQILNRKKAFGVEYLDMVMDSHATPEELRECIARAVEEISTWRGKQAKYQTRIAINQEKLDTKLSPVTNPEIRVTEAAASAPDGSTKNDATASGIDSLDEKVSKVASADVNIEDDITMKESNLKKPPAPSAPPNPFAEEDEAATTTTSTRSTNSNPFGDDDEPPPATTRTTTTRSTSSNPFGDDDEPPPAATRTTSTRSTSTNPFGDDDEPPPATTRTTSTRSTSTNPFGDDDDDEAVAIAEAQPVTSNTQSSTNPFDDEPAVATAELVGAASTKSMDL